MIIKHGISGFGIPVAFIVTNFEIPRPLARWLAWLKQTLLLPNSMAFMTHCSATEMGAIETIFGHLQIYLCHWHILRAIQTQVSKKISIPHSDSGTLLSLSRNAINKQIRKSTLMTSFNRHTWGLSPKLAEFGKIMLQNTPSMRIG